MITIYSQAKRNVISELRVVSHQALGALQEAIEQLEASGKPAATERQMLKSLQSVLDGLETDLHLTASRLD